MENNLRANQKAAYDLGLEDKLDIIDLVIFDFMVSFSTTTKCRKKIEGDTVYFWIKWDFITKNIPMLPVKGRSSVYKRIKKLIDNGLLEAHSDNQVNAQSFYCFTSLSDRFLFFDPVSENEQGCFPKETGGVYLEKHNNSIIDNSIKNKNTGDVLLKNSDNSNTENQNTLKEREINPNTPQVAPSLPSSPNKEKEKEEQSSVKSTETRRKSTNGIKDKYSYQKEIESVLKRFNLISGKSRSATDAITKKIVSFLEYIQKTEKVEKEKAVQFACDYLEFRADEHDFRPKGYIKKKDYTISSLLTKPKYDRYVEMREERETEIAQKRQKLINQKPQTFFR